MFALSVSISTSSSPTDTSSPTCFNHLRMVPSSIESERRGVTMSCTAGGATSDPRRDLGGGAEAVLHLAHDLALGGHVGVLEARAIGDRRLRAGYHPGVVEVVQALRRDD